MGYTLPLERISLSDYQQLLQKQNLLPGRRMLLDRLDARFAALAALGLSTVLQLKAALSSPTKLAALAAKTGIPEEYLTILRRELGSLEQKPVALSDFPACDPERIRAFTEKGIRTSKEYWEHGGASPDELLSLCDLVRVNGVGAVAARAFYEAGLSPSPPLRGHRPPTCSRVSTRSTKKRVITKRSSAKRTCSFVSTMRNSLKNTINPVVISDVSRPSGLFFLAHIHNLCYKTLQTPRAHPKLGGTRRIMKKGLLLGLLASFFFAFTFLLNRSMHLSGGSWIWSASLRYLFTFPMFALLVWRTSGFSRVHNAIRQSPLRWLLWSTVGFGLFYAPISFAGDHGESWLIAASWQVTIVMGLPLSPLFQKKIAVKNLGAAAVILVGVFLLQLNNIVSFRLTSIAQTLLPILVAAIAYPLGNRKMMALCPPELTTIERVYGMTLCSLPFWVLLAGYGLITRGLPSASQAVQSLGVAVLSGVIATLLFFRATDLVKDSQRQLAVVESTQSFEVLFTLLGGVLLLRDAPPDMFGWVGVGLIVVGMVLSSLASLPKPNARQAAN